MKKFDVSTHLVLFICIVLIGAFLRLYKISSVPPGVNRDEASIGYTAYSLLKTGKDEYARPFPISFQSFGDWKLPLYIYADIPFIAVLGTNELAIRLPSALAGIATIVVIFFLTLTLTQNTNLAFLSMALLAISPWHLHLSRVESESNLAVLFMSLGTLLFLKSIKNHKPQLLLWVAILFALPYFTYHGNHGSTTLILAGLGFLYRKDIPKTKISFIALLIFIGLVAVILSQTFSQADRTKLAGIGIFGNPTIVHEKIELPRLAYPDPNGIVPRLLHNRVTYATRKISQNYINTFLAQFLFIRGGGNHAHNIEGFGNMYLVEAPFLIFGIIALLRALKKGDKKKEISLIIWWLLIAPVTGSITKDAPHTNRAFAIFPILPIVVAMGITWFLDTIKRTKRTKIVLMGIGCAYIVNIAVYLNQYYVHFPKHEAIYWGAGYKALNQVLTSDAYKNMNVIMTHPEHSPYIYLLLYSSYNPNLYFSTVTRYPPTSDGFVNVSHFGRFDFRPINWEDDISLPNTLLVATPEEIPNNIRDNRAYTKTSIILPNERVQFVVIKK